jgi:hypothetical protein
VLAESFLRHEPAGRFYLLVVDGLPSGAALPAGVRVIDVSELGLPDFQAMSFKYTVTELSTAVKPSLLSLLLDRYAELEVVYLDPDILILRPMAELKTVLAGTSIVLIPHLLQPLPRDGLRPSEEDFLLHGAFNLGFIGVRKTEETESFLRWWRQRLDNGAKIDYSRGLFTDQKWVDLVPSLFPSTVIFRDETYNVAWWNLDSRPMTKRGEEYLVNGRPLTFFHFSGFDPNRPMSLGKVQIRTKVVEGTALADLLQLYVDLQMRHGFSVSSKSPYGYAAFDNGVAIPLPLRRAYCTLDEQRRKQFGNPFHVNGSTSFFRWASGGGLMHRVKWNILSGLAKFVLRRVLWRNVLSPHCSMACCSAERIMYPLPLASQSGGRAEG